MLTRGQNAVNELLVSDSSILISIDATKNIQYPGFEVTYPLHVSFPPEVEVKISKLLQLQVPKRRFLDSHMDSNTNGLFYQRSPLSASADVPLVCSVCRGPGARVSSTDSPADSSWVSEGPASPEEEALTAGASLCLSSLCINTIHRDYSRIHAHNNHSNESHRFFTHLLVLCDWGKPAAWEPACVYRILWRFQFLVPSLSSHSWNP